MGGNFSASGIKPAADANHVASNIGSGRRYKEADQLRHLFGLPETVGGNHLLQSRFVEPFDHIRPDETRRDGVDRDVFAGDLLRQRFGGGNNSAFGSRVVGLSGQC